MFDKSENYFTFIFHCQTVSLLKRNACRGKIGISAWPFVCADFRYAALGVIPMPSNSFIELKLRNDVRRLLKAVGIFALLCGILVFPLQAQVSVLTQHNDN